MASATVHMMFPAAPNLGSLRLGLPSDIPRIAIAAMAGFRYSPLFQWERPYHNDFPEDTFLSYSTQFRDAMKSDDAVVLVAEDSFRPDENDSTDAVIPPNNGWPPPAEGDKVVVGVAAIKLEPGSKRHGQFKVDGNYPDLPPNPGRDLNRKHYDTWGEKVGAAKKKYCSGYSSMGMLVVHPAYWKRGHATELIQWSIGLCELDGANQGVSAADMAVPLYKRLGYRKICEIREEGDQDDPEGVSTELLEYLPATRNNL